MNQTNRISRVLGKGAYARLLFYDSASPSLSGYPTSLTLAVVPSAHFVYQTDPRLFAVNEAKGKGSFVMRGTELHAVHIDCRRRNGYVATDLLGLTNAYYVAVILDIGSTGNCNIIRGMSRGPYSLESHQLRHVTEGFTLSGGHMIARNVSIPDWARGTNEPLITWYKRTNVAYPGEYDL